MDHKKCIGIAARALCEDDVITINIVGGVVSSSDIIIDPEFTASDVSALVLHLRSREKNSS